MDLDTALASELLERFPDEAARTLEALPVAQREKLLSVAAVQPAAQVLRRLAAHGLGELLAQLEPERLAAMLSELEIDVAARILRHLEPERRTRVLEALDRSRARSLRTLLRHREDSAGALLDPDVLGLSASHSANTALELMRAHPAHARYNLYVVDDDQHLIGVLNLRELMLAPADAPLRQVMHPATHQIPSHADRHQIASHPGWRDVHAIPVVDADGTFLGAIRYRTLRRIETELAGLRNAANPTARALGELYATGATSLLEALTGGVQVDRGDEP